MGLFAEVARWLRRQGQEWLQYPQDYQQSVKQGKVIPVEQLKRKY